MENKSLEELCNCLYNSSMREYNVLFCFSNSISDIVSSLEVYCVNKPYDFQINQIDNFNDFININNFCEYDCVIIQEYFCEQNPIDINFLINFFAREIRVICVFSEDKRDVYGKLLYENGIYNCFFGDDAVNCSVDILSKIIIYGRSEAEAREYYKLPNYFFYLIKRI